MIALLPLDNRPCNLRFPQQIAGIGNSELLVPPVELLGFFNTPGSSDALANWLRDLPEVEALIVSIDMLAYGGLVASRRPKVDVEQARQRLSALRIFHEKCPRVPIYAFNVLMRLAVTMDSDKAVANYYNVMRYARLVDEAERFGSEHLRLELAKVTEQIPPDVLQEYLAARARNHSVNRLMVEWLGEGIFDSLLITQEDATEFGLHRREQDDLLKLAGEMNVGERFSLHPGADEAALTLLARHWNTGVRLRVHWSNVRDSARVAPFEDRPYNIALQQHIAAMRGRAVGENEDADFELFVNAPVGGSQKDEGEAERAIRHAGLRPFLREIAAAADAGAKIAVCDVGFPNGADNMLMTELEERNLLGRLSVFGGWNTAGNTTGTVLAQCAALLRGGGATAIQNRTFLFERYIDDWLYQARVRARIEKIARDLGVSPLNMNDDYTQVEAQTRRELTGLAQVLAKRHFGATLDECRIALPWHRTFEVAFRATFKN